MKNKFILKTTIAILAALTCSANIAFAIPKTAILKTAIVKFSFVMIGVIIFSFVIYLGLSIYNRFFVADYIKNFAIRKNSFNTPKDKDEAILTYIDKNRLK